MNLKVISRNVGFALLASAFFMFLSILVSVSRGNDSALAALCISFILTFTVGIFPFIFVRRTPNISLKDGYMIIVLSWLLSFVFGMLPYVLWGGPFSVLNALFESVSGYTTTGATILEDVEVLPDSLLFWRSATHFIGGLGVVVFLLLIIPSSSPVRLRLTNMELSSLSREGYRSRANKTVWIFTSVYAGLTLLAFLSYWAAGMSAFDAVNHAFSVAATGGFSTKTLSIAAFDSKLINVITMVFMFLSSIHFGIIYMTVATRTLRPLNNPVLKFYVMSIIVCAVISAVSLKAGGFGWGESIMNGSFNVLSFVSTTGFAISDSNCWPMSVCVIMMLLSIICGMSGSTSGGIKADRALLLFKSIAQQIRTVLHPSSVMRVRIGQTTMGKEDLYPHVVFTGLYFVLISGSLVLSVFAGMNLGDALAASVSSLGNVGPCVSGMGTFGNFLSVPAGAKAVFMADMFIGRIEIYPAVSVIAAVFGGHR